MTTPLMVITTIAIKEGQLEGFKQFVQKFFKVIEANQPRLLAMDAHDGARRHFQDAITSIQVYGKPSDASLENARELERSGVAVNVKSEHLGGFTRQGEAAR